MVLGKSSQTGLKNVAEGVFRGQVLKMHQNEGVVIRLTVRLTGDIGPEASFIRMSIDYIIVIDFDQSRH